MTILVSFSKQFVFADLLLADTPRDALFMNVLERGLKRLNPHLLRTKGMPGVSESLSFTFAYGHGKLIVSLCRRANRDREVGLRTNDTVPATPF